MKRLTSFLLALALLLPMVLNAFAVRAEELPDMIDTGTVWLYLDDTDPKEPTGSDLNSETVDVPPTGDNSSMLLCAILLFVSCAGVIGTMVYDRKKTAK